MKKLIVTLAAIIMVALIVLGMVYDNGLNTKEEVSIEATTVETIEGVEEITEVIEATTEVETTVAIEEAEDDVKHMVHINHDLATGKLSIEG